MMGLKIQSLYAVTTALLLGGCFSSEAPRHQAEGAKTGRGPRYVKGIYSEPLSLDPAQMNDTASLVVANFLYDGLLSFSPSLELRGALAESWSTSRDGKTLTFRLRKGTKFHDGSAITPKAVISSFHRVIAPESKVYSYYDCILGAEEYHQGKTSSVLGIKQPGANAVEITLRYPFPPFLSVLAGATAKIIPPVSNKTKDFFANPVGSGAFKLSRREKGKHHTDIILERFDSYYGTKPEIAELVLRAMNEKEALKQAADGQIHDLASFPLSGQESVFRFGNHLHAPNTATWIIGLNTRSAPFTDAKVRRAFRDSIDAEAFRTRFHPDSVPAHGYIPPGLPGYELKYKSVAAMPLKKTVSRKKIRLAIPDALARSFEMKQFFEQTLKNKGWDVEVVPMEWSAMMKGYSEKTLQAFLVSMNIDYPDTEFLVRNFESTNPDNFSGINDPEIDSLIRKARATQDRIARQKIYVELVSLLNDEAVTVNLFHPRWHAWVSPCVSGLEANILSDVYIDYRAVRVDPGCKTLARAGL